MSPLHSRAEANAYQPPCPDGETEARCRGTCLQPHKKPYTQSKTKATQLGEGICAEHHQIHCCSLLGFRGDISKAVLPSGSVLFWSFPQQLPPGFGTARSTFSLAQHSHPEIPTSHRYLPCNIFTLSKEMMLFRSHDPSLSQVFRGGGDGRTITSQLRGHDMNYSNQDDLAAFQCLPWPGKTAIPPHTRLILMLSPV